MVFPTHIIAAGGYVEDKSGNILLVKTHNRGWDVPGGQIEIGENLEEGLLREIMEESGIKAAVRCLTGVYSNVGQHLFYDGQTNVPTKVLFDFICDYISGEPAISDETSEVMWIPKNEAIQYITSPALLYRLPKVLAFDGRICYGSYVSKPEFQVLSERYI